MSQAVTSDAANTGRRYHSVKTPLDSRITSVSQRIGGDKAKEVERFIKFGFVGLLGFTIDFGTVAILQFTILPANSGQYVALVSSVAFVLAVCSNFVWNRLWTYPDSRSFSLRRQLTQFAIVSVIGLAIRNLWLASTYEFLGEQSTSVIQSLDAGYSPQLLDQNNLGTLIALCFGVVIVMFWNFLANRYWTYNDVD